METTKKFELLKDDVVYHHGKRLFRIRAIKTFGDVSAGNLGGFVETEENLSQTGNAWVGGNAQVYGDAWVGGNAQVYGDARVCGDAQVYDTSRVSGDAWVYDNAQVYDDAWVSGDAQVYGNALVYGDAWVYGDAQVYGDARVCFKHEIVWFSGVGSEFGTLTVCKSEDGLFVSRGCFAGSDLQFLKAVEERHGDSRIGREYKMLIEVARSRILGDSED